jgi:preprotein translocase subunit SecF
MARKPTNLREHRKQTERRALLAVVLALVVVGSVFVGLVYDWGAALTALACLLPGAITLVVLWLLLVGIERLMKD